MASFSHKPSPKFPDAYEGFNDALRRALHWTLHYNQSNYYDRIRAAIEDVRSAAAKLETQINIEDSPRGG